VASAYAFFNAGKLTVRSYTLPIPNLEAPLRVAHLSDIHVGTMHREAFLRRVVTLTNSTQPDVILITGDLFDGSAPIDEPILRPLNELRAPTYFSTGNHEEYEGMDNVRTTLSHLSLTFLENAVTEFRGVRLIGVNDRHILPRTTTLGMVLDSLNVQADSTPTILLYHTPVEWETARSYGVSLMLSGHTHNGQIFPFNLLVRAVYRYVCGLYKEDDMYLHVSPGTGTWGPPMRLGSRCQVTVLNLVPKVTV
jgi:predicted MPP superfamily phosphohydrolase